MPSTRLTHVLLSVIAFALSAIALRPYLQPAPVLAQAASGDPVYIEPGVYLLRIPDGGQVLGKIAVNLRTGTVWGYPTNSSDPYPTSPLGGAPQVSHPFSLGRFAVNEANK